MKHHRFTQLPRAWRLIAPLLGAVLLHGAASAGTDVNRLITTVERLQPSVTYGNPTATPPLLTFIGYRVTITNTGRESLSNIRFTGASTVTEPGESAPVASVDGASCTITASAVDCAIGTLKGGQSAPSFAIFFAAPAKLAGSTLPSGIDGSCTTTDCVAFAGRTASTDYDDGYAHEARSTPWGPVFVTLAAPDPNRVSTAVPKTGGTVFTGQGGVTSAVDPLTTTVVVPPGTAYTTAQIAEASTTTLCGVLTTCFTSDLTVPGTFSPYLQVVLRLDSSAIPRGTKITSVLISYDGLVIGDCASPTTPRTDGIPCIAARRTIPVATTTSTAPTSTTKRKSRDDDCYTPESFEWTLINTKNGSIKIF